MKIVVVTQYFYPEDFKVNDLVKGFVERGHQVTVLTGKPNYPFGTIFKGYKQWGIQRERLFGADVIRVPVIPRGKGRLGFKTSSTAQHLILGARPLARKR